MNEFDVVPLEILLFAGTIIGTLLIGRMFRAVSVPPLIGYIAIGFCFSIIDSRINIITPGVRQLFRFLAELGVIALLFRVGLESKVAGLLRQLRKASRIWVADVVVSGAFGFLAAYYVLDLALIPSLFVGTALTATSVGVSVAVWQEANATTSPTGELLLDVAEMDDISGVVLMAFLLFLAPALQSGAGMHAAELSELTVVFIMKLLGIGAFCIAFALYAERHVMKFYMRIRPSPDPMLLVTATGLIIAALTGLIGFSSAIGAFFAGLIFSRDARSVKIDRAFGAIYELFVPFFFVGIGLSIDPGTIGAALPLSGILLSAAILGKMIGAGGLTMASEGRRSALLIGMSMIPRAEIAMVIMQKGLSLGKWAVPSQLFSAMVIVPVMTCIISPPILQNLLQRWPPQKAERGNMR